MSWPRNDREKKGKRERCTVHLSTMQHVCMSVPQCWDGIHACPSSLASRSKYVYAPQGAQICMQEMVTKENNHEENQSLFCAQIFFLCVEGKVRLAVSYF